jgi:transcriptional regulator with XRE-family HTH domain
MPGKMTDRAKRKALSPFDVNIALRMSDTRTKLGLTITDLAKTVGMSQAQLSRLEGGLQGFRSATLHKIADALHVSVKFLVAGDKEASAASVVKEQTFYGPGMPTEVITALKSGKYKKFILKAAELFMKDEETFSELSAIVRRAKVKYWP